MAIDKCYKTELEREYQPDPASGYRPVEGRHISIHPPPCFGSEGRERSVEYHRILKDKYGVTGVHVGTLAHIEIALEAGFKCNEIIYWPVGHESYAYDESIWSDVGEWWSRVGNLSFDNEEFYFLFEAASNYNLEEVNLYAWEYLFEGIPCEVQVELFWQLMDRLARTAATKGWLQYPRQTVSYKQHLYKCKIRPCDFCDPDDPSVWIRM
ncbi:MAG: hypothetical protein RRA94_07160 [Bacteroidota bacterium]|nr:hypothetical protein [Bacteroidota bacterium]